MSCFNRPVSLFLGRFLALPPRPPKRRGPGPHVSHVLPSPRRWEAPQRGRTVAWINLSLQVEDEDGLLRSHGGQDWNLHLLPLLVGAPEVR